VSREAIVLLLKFATFGIVIVVLVLSLFQIVHIAAWFFNFPRVMVLTTNLIISVTFLGLYFYCSKSDLARIRSLTFKDVSPKTSDEEQSYFFAVVGALPASIILLALSIPLASKTLTGIFEVSIRVYLVMGIVVCVLLGILGAWIGYYYSKSKIKQK
jgi:hypothetical protein